MTSRADATLSYDDGCNGINFRLAVSCFASRNKSTDKRPPCLSVCVCACDCCLDVIVMIDGGEDHGYDGNDDDDDDDCDGDRGGARQLQDI